jgi:hypothetical protein
MRVRGSKTRVRLTEVELEPSEQKPMLRIAPAAASLIWLGSIALATAIYMEWLPARALFEPETRTLSQRSARRERPLPQESTASPRSTGSPAAPRPAPLAEATPAPTTAPPVAAPVPSPDTSITTPPTVPESSRTIRGSYYSEDSSWAAGW